MEPLKDQKKQPQPEPVEKKESGPSLVPVCISSTGIETHPRKVDGKTVHFVKGSINGIPFEIECNKQVMVEPHIAEAVAGLGSR
jgi:hypothetical protein